MEVLELESSLLEVAERSMMYLVQICLACQTTIMPEQCKFTAWRRIDLHNVDLASRRPQPCAPAL